MKMKGVVKLLLTGSSRTKYTKPFNQAVTFGLRVSNINRSFIWRIHKNAWSPSNKSLTRNLSVGLYNYYPGFTVFLNSQNFSWYLLKKNNTLACSSVENVHLLWISYMFLEVLKYTREAQNSAISVTSSSPLTFRNWMSRVIYRYCRMANEISPVMCCSFRK